MKKTYWWRIIIISVIFILIGIAYILRNQIQFNICDNIYSFGDYHGCLDKGSQTIGKPLFITSLFLLSISPFLFFISDKAFLKWLRFALTWLVLSFVFIALAPVYRGGWMNIGPTKESISIWMGSLFIIISLIKIIWDSKQKKL